MDKFISIIASLFDPPNAKDPWAKYRNKGGPIPSNVGELLLFLTIIAVLIYMIAAG